ncbi:MAG: hypothetical protein H6Q75_109 [Firmicutes bacterium]|nr:hypothetical protein [Bacillota bacterium]
MTKFRVEITKGEEIRYISHLDYARTIERALRRSKLPMAYSEGFNPHMKFSFASALSVGVASQAEYMEVELKEPMDAAEFSARLARTLPPAITVCRVKEVVGKQPALMAIVNLAVYHLAVPLENKDEVERDGINRAIREFNAALEVLYVKESPKGRREIDVKQYMAEDATVTVGQEKAEIMFSIRITPQGSVKPGEVLKVLVKEFQFPGKSEAAVITRLGLYVEKSKTRFSPLEMG